MMWNRNCLDSEKKIVSNNKESDSGFLSCPSGNLSSMKTRNCCTCAADSLVHELSYQHSCINNLGIRNKSESTMPSRLNVKWSEVDKNDRLDKKLDILNQPHEFFFTQDCDGDTQLHISISLGHLEASLWLISRAPNPSFLDIVNDQSQTALHLAVLTRQAKIVRRLVIAGANIKMRTSAGNTALHIACSIGDFACVKALTEPFNDNEEKWSANNGAKRNSTSFTPDLEVRNYDGKTPLHVAASNGYIDLVDQLVRYGADVNIKEGLAGKTALHIAVESNCRDMVKYLAKECASCLDILTYAGVSAYELALDIDQRIADDLLRYGASAIVRSNDTDSSSCYDSSSDDETDNFSPPKSSFTVYTNSKTLVTA